MTIDIVDRQRARKVALKPLSAFLGKLVASEPPPPGATALAVALVSDRRMRELNRTFRGIDSATDVLSFPGEGDYLGDIAISPLRAAIQARERAHPLSREIRTLLVHGYLHLLGYDHETDGGRMMRRQRALLARLEERGARR